MRNKIFILLFIFNSLLIIGQEKTKCVLSDGVKSQKISCVIQAYLLADRIDEVEDSMNLYVYTFFRPNLEGNITVDIFDLKKSFQSTAAQNISFIEKYDKNTGILPIKISVGKCSFEKKIDIPKKDFRYLYIILGSGTEGYSCSFLFTDYAFFY
jgi:hypothetical protein